MLSDMMAAVKLVAVQALGKTEHLTIDNIIVIALECFHSLPLAAASLRHDELNVLVLDSGRVDLALVFIVLLGRGSGRRLHRRRRLALVGGRCRCAGLLLRSCQLLSGRSLRLRVKVLDLGLTEDTEVDV